MPRMPGRRAAKAGATGNLYGLGVVNEGDKAGEALEELGSAHYSGFTSLYSPFIRFEELFFPHT